MDYTQCRDILESYQAFGSHYGLEVIQTLLDALDRPDRALKIIHVAGTNGKGSTISFLSSILDAAGQTYTTYTSPEVYEYLDRFRINQKPASPEVFTKACSEVIRVADDIVSSCARHASLFEMELAIALLLARDSGRDFYIQETGLGGRLDASNAVKEPMLILMTPVALDHMEFLGSDLRSIAEEKAGIFKEGVPIISAPQAPAVRQVFEKRALEHHAPLHILNKDSIGIHNGALVYDNASYPLSLLGNHQKTNATLAIEAARFLSQNYMIREKDIREGLRKASWPGRLEVLQEHPRIYLDGAHNPQAAQALAHYLQEEHPNKDILSIAHFYADKDVPGILEAMAPVLSKLILPEIGLPRSLAAAEAKKLAKKWMPGTALRTSPSLKDAMRESITELNSENVLVVFGSLSHLQDARLAYAAIKKEGLIHDR